MKWSFGRNGRDGGGSSSAKGSEPLAEVTKEPVTYDATLSVPNSPTGFTPTLRPIKKGDITFQSKEVEKLLKGHKEAVFAYVSGTSDLLHRKGAVLAIVTQGSDLNNPTIHGGVVLENMLGVTANPNAAKPVILVKDKATGGYRAVTVGSFGPNVTREQILICSLGAAPTITTVTPQVETPTLDGAALPTNDGDVPAATVADPNPQEAVQVNPTPSVNVRANIPLNSTPGEGKTLYTAGDISLTDGVVSVTGVALQGKGAIININNKSGNPFSLKEGEALTFSANVSGGESKVIAYGNAGEDISPSREFFSLVVIGEGSAARVYLVEGIDPVKFMQRDMCFGATIEKSKPTGGTVITYVNPIPPGG